MTNPAPSVITDSMWRLWTDRPDSTWKLGGIFANKKCYHNTVENNLRNWPGGYCVRFSLDLNHGPRDKARAIDYTMSSAKMKLYTGRLVAAADRNDPRCKGMRDFYGTTNGSTVVGRIRDDDSSNYRFSSSDASHLWHIHISVWATYCDDWRVLSGILSILSGESLSAWQRRTMFLIEFGDKGEPVRYWQRRLLRLGYKLPEFGADGDYGDETQKAITASRKHYGYGNTGLKKLSGWHAEQLDADLAGKGEKGDPGPPPTDAQIAKAVTAWVTSNMDKVIPVNEIENRVLAWLTENRETIRGEPGKTPVEIEISHVGKVTKVE